MSSSRAADAPDEHPRPREEPVPPDERPDIDDELIGLDPNDPETRAFAAHLERMRREQPTFTVEGYLAGVEDFADSANRAGGLRRLGAVVLVLLILLGVAVSIWFGLGEIVSIFFD